MYGKNAQDTVLIQLTNDPPPNAGCDAGGQQTAMPEFCGNGAFVAPNPEHSMPAGLGNGQSGYGFDGQAEMPATCPGSPPGTPVQSNAFSLCAFRCVDLSLLDPPCANKVGPA